MNSVLKYEAADENGTVRLGTALAQSLLACTLTPTLSQREREESGTLNPALSQRERRIQSAGAVIGLIGPLGAGKTRLVQAVVKAAGVEEGTVASPTFVLVHEYQGHVPIFHFDAYRLRNEHEFAALGPEEYFSRPGWSFIEWADRVINLLPTDRLEISIEATAPAARQFTLRALGVEHEKVLAEVNRQLSLSAKP
jgi:tRNA threonylcarbamoyladenosine biosynthesis protein TsaE